MVLSRSHIFCLLLLCVVTLEEVIIEESSNIESLHAPRGGAVELPCDVTPSLSGDSMALVIWYKQGHDAPVYSVDLREEVTSHWSDPSTLGPRATFRTSVEPAVLVITNLRAEDSGQYRCRVDFSKSPTKNTRLNLTVLIPPDRLLILDQDGEEVRGGVIGPYDEGVHVNVTCVAVGGRPPARVSWWKSHSLLANSETRASVTFPLRRADYGTNVTCQAVTDPSIPPLSQTLTVDVNLRLLRVDLLGGKRPLVAGVSTELVCQAIGARPKPTISWWKGGERLKTVRETVSPDGNVTSSILTLVPSIDDAGRVISCRAVQPTVPHSTREDGWKLEIQHLPVVTLRLGASLDPGALVEGSDVYLDCDVRANPWHTSVYFTHNGVVVKPGPGVLVANQSLVLQRVGRRAGGAYACAARSALGQGTSEPLHLDVKYSPSCRAHQPKVIRAARGELVEIDCDVDANPKDPMTFDWWFNSSTHEKRELTTTKTIRSPSRYSYTIQSSSDYGWVQCAGSNSVGRQAAPCVFTVLPAEKPSPVRECTVWNVTYESLRVACERGHDGGLKQAFLLHVYDQSTATLLRNLTSDEPSFVVWGLAESAAVRLSIRAFNDKGASDPITVSAKLMKVYEKHTASVPVTIELSTVLVIVLCAVALTATGAALATSVMCCRYCGRREDKGDKSRKDVSDKPLTGECDSVDSIDKNPDIIPIEGKASDTSSNKSTIDRSTVRPLIPKNFKYDDRYYDSYPFNQYVDLPPMSFRYQPNLPMPNIGTMCGPNVQCAGQNAQCGGQNAQCGGQNAQCGGQNAQCSGQNAQFGGQTGQFIGQNIPCSGLDECGVPHEPMFEDWLKYKNSLPVNASTSYPPDPLCSVLPVQYRVRSPHGRASPLEHKPQVTPQQCYENAVVTSDV